MARDFFTEREPTTASKSRRSPNVKINPSEKRARPLGLTDLRLKSPSEHNYIPKSLSASNSRGPATRLSFNGRYTFIREKPDIIWVGISRSRDVWLSLSWDAYQSGRAPHLRPQYYDAKLNEHFTSVIEPSITWVEEFAPSSFPLTNEDGKKDHNFQRREQRKYIYGVIEEHGGANIGRNPDTHRKSNTSGSSSLNRTRPREMVSSSPPDQDPSITTSNNKRRHRSSTGNAAVVEIDGSGPDEEDDSDAPFKRLRHFNRPPPVVSLSQFPGYEGEKVTPKPAICGFTLPSDVVDRTTFLISAPPPLDFGTIHVAFAEWSKPEDMFKALEDRFQILADKFGLKGKGPSELYVITAKWDKRSHLICRDQPHDWAQFLKGINESWNKRRERFEENGCKIRLTTTAKTR